MISYLWLILHIQGVVMDRVFGMVLFYLKKKKEEKDKKMKEEEEKQEGRTALPETVFF
jgi:hypothetical protein